MKKIPEENMSKRDTYRLYNAIKLKPLGSKMVVELDDQDEKTPGGLIVAHATNDGMTKGTVLAIRGICIHSVSSFKSVGCGNFQLPIDLAVIFFLCYLFRWH